MNYFNKRVYVAGIFQNKPENKEYIEKWCLKLSKIFPDYLFINGVSAFSYYYDHTDLQQGMDMCAELLKCCDSLVTVSDYSNSIGTFVELYIAKENDMHIYEHIDTRIKELEEIDGKEYYSPSDFGILVDSYAKTFFGA